jgi:hypothetical protein
MNKTFFAYHITHVFGPFGLESYHTKSTNVREGDLVYVLSGNKTRNQAGVDYFLEGIFLVYRRHLGPYMLKNLNGEPSKFEYRLSMKPVRVPERAIALSAAEWYDRKQVHDYFSSGQNFNPLPTNPDYKERFDLLLAEYGSTAADDLTADLLDLDATVPDATERQVLASARVGQGRFRAGVIRLWGRGEVCAVSGLDVPELLVASHIKPWRESTNEERLAPENGLLLASHIDKMFDRHLLSFKHDRSGYTVAIHPRVERAMGKLGVKVGLPLQDNHLSPSSSRKFERYMGGHYDIFNQRLLDDKAT